MIDDLDLFANMRVITLYNFVLFWEGFFSGYFGVLVWWVFFVIHWLEHPIGSYRSKLKSIVLFYFVIQCRYVS